MKLTRLCIRAAACLLPLSLVLICVVTPIVLPAQDIASPPPTEPATAGEVRISDVAEPATGRLETPAADSVATVERLAESVLDEGDTEVVIDEDAGTVTVSDLWNDQSQQFLTRNRHQSESISNWVYVRLGLYTPASIHTSPIGTYRMVYPVNPGYNDPHDARVYGVQGVGIPIVVPLAPVVRSSYNYGSGLPASRLTPVSVPR